MNQQHETAHQSVVGSFGAATLLAVALVVVSHPVAFAVAGVVVIAVGVTLRAFWRRLRSGGITLPGTTAKLCVARQQEKQWSLIVAFGE